MKVKDIMTKYPACCTPETELSDVARIMADRDCGQIPVVDNQTTKRVIGVVTDRDIVVRAVADQRDTAGMTAGDIMSTPAVTVRPESSIEECCRTLEEHKFRRAPVVDEHDCCCGMISQADIAQHASGKLTAEVVKTVSQPVHH